MLDSKSVDNWVLESNANKEEVAVIKVHQIDEEHGDLWRPDDQNSGSGSQSFDQFLCDYADISGEQLAQAQTIHQKSPRKRLGQILVEMGVVTEEQLLECLAKQYELPFIRMENEVVDPEAFEKLDKVFIETHNVLPYGLEDGKLILAMSDPADIFLQDEIRRRTKLQLEIKVCPSGDIKEILNKLNEDSSDYQVDDIIQDMDDEDIEVIKEKEEDISDLEQAAGDSPIIKFVNYLILTAVKDGASDIHIEPGDKKLKIRNRIDGILFVTMNPPLNMHPAVVSRIKIMADLDIAERRLPQDGRIRVVMHGRNIDMRISTLPSTHGEKVVIRILDSGNNNLTLKDLGMEEDTLKILENQMHKPHGIVLVTGPTGSGKSTTLYGALRTMNMQKLNISTVEDPVEYQMDGVTQVQVLERIGLTFASALRALLRQDPDVIMVGEIRDEETARVAIQASLTGHLVLSTLHTNDAPSSITRLINIGIEPYLIAASTNAILAQRLARKICQHCKVPYEPEAEHVGFLQMYGFSSDNMFKGQGCDKCRQTGYQGRLGLYEQLVIDDTYRDIITKNPTVTELRRLCNERGMVSLRDDGFRKVQAGLTTVDEVMRVTESTI